MPTVNQTQVRCSFIAIFHNYKEKKKKKEAHVWF